MRLNGMRGLGYQDVPDANLISAVSRYQAMGPAGAPLLAQDLVTYGLTTLILAQRLRAAGGNVDVDMVNTFLRNGGIDPVAINRQIINAVASPTPAPTPSPASGLPADTHTLTAAEFSQINDLLTSYRSSPGGQIGTLLNIKNNGYSAQFVAHYGFTIDQAIASVNNSGWWIPSATVTPPPPAIDTSLVYGRIGETGVWENMQGDVMFAGAKSQPIDPETQQTGYQFERASFLYGPGQYNGKGTAYQIGAKPTAEFISGYAALGATTKYDADYGWIIYAPSDINAIRVKYRNTIYTGPTTPGSFFDGPGPVMLAISLFAGPILYAEMMGTMGLSAAESTIASKAITTAASQAAQAAIAGGATEAAATAAGTAAAANAATSAGLTQLLTTTGGKLALGAIGTAITAAIRGTTGTLTPIRNPVTGQPQYINPVTGNVTNTPPPIDYYGNPLPDQSAGSNLIPLALFAGLIALGGS